MMRMLIWMLLASARVLGQPDTLPYREIPDYPSTYTAATVAARLVDGLGFRYYWATDGLREEDLAYKPGENTRTTYETLVHIYSLTEIMLNSVHEVPTDFTKETPSLSFSQ